MVNKPRVIIEYRNNKNSCGKVVDGVIHLTISNRLGIKERKRHINRLTQRLVDKINWARQFQFDDKKGIVKTDEELWRLAEMINNRYYNLPLENASFHKQNSTWGTCSPQTRQIYISHRLIGAAWELLWYVVTHEICHLAERAHNRKFWELVSKACPNYQECRKKLKAYGLQ